MGCKLQEKSIDSGRPTSPCCPFQRLNREKKSAGGETVSHDLQPWKQMKLILFLGTLNRPCVCPGGGLLAFWPHQMCTVPPSQLFEILIRSGDSPCSVDLQGKGSSGNQFFFSWSTAWSKSWCECSKRTLMCLVWWLYSWKWFSKGWKDRNNVGLAGKFPQEAFHDCSHCVNGTIDVSHRRSNFSCIFFFPSRKCLVLCVTIAGIPCHSCCPKWDRCKCSCK